VGESLPFVAISELAMNLLSYVGFALLLLTGLMLDAHRRTWRGEVAREESNQRERRAARAQYLRRMQASGTLALLGGLLMVNPLIPLTPLAFGLYTLALVVCCGWILMLGVVDAFATWVKAHKVRERQMDAREKLEAELRAAREKK
jgi:threonine/homoserine/homoserine lactone efflux protein